MHLALLLAVLAAADAGPKEALRRVYVGAYLTGVSDFEATGGNRPLTPGVERTS